MLNDNLRPHHLNTVFHKYTDELNFPEESSRTILQHGARLIASICTNLTSLDLSLTNIGCIHLENVVKSIPSIEYINLENTSTSDSVLIDVGDHFPNLRVLDVRGTEVTDVGLMALCVENYRPYEFLPTCRGLCRLIQKLLVSGTKVSNKGAETVIANLPHLRHFDYTSVLKVVETIHSQNADNQLTLEYINCGNTWPVNITKYTLDAAACLCPNVTKIDITVGGCDWDHEWLPKLANFHRLRELSVKRVGYDVVWDYGRLKRVLKAIGNNLKSLTLTSVDGVDLLDIGISCRQLSRLCLDDNCSFSIIPHGVNVPLSLFSKLREIVISRHFSRDQLQMLLINCSQVQVLTFESCGSLTDDLLSRVFECNAFSELRAFTVKYCNNIRISSILSLVRNSELLTEITCWACLRIRSADLMKLQDIVRRENLDITLTFSKDWEYRFKPRKMKTNISETAIFSGSNVW